MSSLLPSKTEPGPHQDRRTTAHTLTYSHTHTHTHTRPGNSCLWSCLTTQRDRASSLSDRSAGSQGPPTEVGQHSLYPLSPPDSPPHHITSTSPHSSFSTETKPGQVIRLFLALPWQRTQKHIQASVKAIDGDNRRQLFICSSVEGQQRPQGERW